MRMLFQMLFAATLSLGVATTAQAATVIDTGAGSAGANNAPITYQKGTAGQFVITTKTIITGIELFGTVLQGGTLALGISYSSNNIAPDTGQTIKYLSQAISANSTAAWVGMTNIAGFTLDPGTYWIRAGTENVLSMLHYTSAPNPLANEALYEPNATYTEVDGLGLAWRFSGTQVAEPPVTPVPEPAAWLLLILGFGVVGAALRQGGVRRVVAA